ncbi:MAG: DNA polymerase [Desulfomonilaceae bacterium]
MKARSTGARIVMTVHDSIWIEAPQKTAEEIRHLVRQIMTAAMIKVPMDVDIN